MLPRNYANCIVRTTSSFQLSNFRIENVPIKEVRSKIAINIAVTAKYFSVNLSGNQLDLQRIVTVFENFYAFRNIIRIVTRRDCRDYTTFITYTTITFETNLKTSIQKLQDIYSKHVLGKRLTLIRSFSIQRIINYLNSFITSA